MSALLGTNLAKRLKTERLRLGLTQDEFAKKIGFSRQTILKWERDSDAASASLREVQAFSLLLEIPVEELLSVQLDKDAIAASVRAAVRAELATHAAEERERGETDLYREERGQKSQPPVGLPEPVDAADVIQVPSGKSVDEFGNQEHPRKTRGAERDSVEAGKKGHTPSSAPPTAPLTARPLQGSQSGTADTPPPGRIYGEPGGELSPALRRIVEALPRLHEETIKTFLEVIEDELGSEAPPPSKQPQKRR